MRRMVGAMAGGARVLLVLVLGMIVTGCGVLGDHLEEDKFLSGQLADLRQRGGALRLADITEPGWDKVYVSHHPVSRDYVEKMVGSEVEMEDEFLGTGNVLVFLDGATVREASYISPHLLPPGTYSNNVRIVAPGFPALLQANDG